MATASNRRSRGLPSLNEARAERKRALVTGKARIYGGSPQFWMWTALGVAAFTVVYWKFAQGALESQKSALMSKQRAIAETLGPRIIPFRDKIEGWVLDLANANQPRRIDGSIELRKIQKGPGVYLRLRLANAQDRKSIRAAAQDSLRDGFTSCLFIREESPAGKACTKRFDCPSGTLCNDWSVCARPSQPFNMRLAYRALRVLSPEWTDELHEATSDLGVRAFELDLEAVTKNDVPLAIEVLTRARYFTAVLDEDPPGGLPPPLGADGGTGAETVEERLHRAPHRARVGIWDLRTGRSLVMMRAHAAGEFVPVGDRVVRGSRTVGAQARQVNSCALALAVKDALMTVERARAVNGGAESAKPSSSAEPKSDDL